jgi:hypothetical protein
LLAEAFVAVDAAVAAAVLVDVGAAVAIAVAPGASDAPLLAVPPHAARMIVAEVRTFSTFSTYLTSDGLREWDDATTPRRRALCMKSA